MILLRKTANSAPKAAGAGGSGVASATREAARPPSPAAEATIGTGRVWARKVHVEKTRMEVGAPTPEPQVEKLHKSGSLRKVVAGYFD